MLDEVVVWDHPKVPRTSCFPVANGPLAHDVTSELYHSARRLGVQLEHNRMAFGR